MKKLQILTGILWIFLSSSSFAQVAPYIVSPKWFYGFYAGLDFTSGSAVWMNGNRSAAGENSTTICDTLKNVVMYSPSHELWKAGAATATLTGVGGTSSTAGSIIVPDPSNPYDRYYFITANDVTGGSIIGGINAYVVTNTGAALTTSPIINLAGNVVDESLGACADGSGGYWIVSHSSTASTFYKWHITSTAGITSIVASTQTVTPTVQGTANAAIKFNRCQTKIAWTGNDGYVQVFDFNRVTGNIGTNRYSGQPPFFNATSVRAYGLEFSLTGDFLYHACLGPTGNIKQLEVSTGVWTLLSEGSTNNNYVFSEIGTMQLAPDGKIYVANGGWNVPSITAAKIGVVNNPEVAGTGCNYNGSGFVMPNTSTPTSQTPFTYRGLANIAWLNPDLRINHAQQGTTCEYKFSHNFLTHTRDIITETTTAIRWDFTNDGTWDVTGNATPSYEYGTAGGTFQVKLEVTDATCSQTFTKIKSITVPACTLPVDLVSFTGNFVLNQVKLQWQTAIELNNDYFDIQRSFDGVHFESIAHVQGYGNSSQLLSYTYNDADIASGPVYYRLDQYDFDGTKSSSKIVIVHRSVSTPFTLAPNPFSSSFVINKLDDEAATILVYDILGRLLEQKYCGPEEETFVLGEELNTGSYIVKYMSQSSTYALHIEKK